ncbi:MAG: PilZ domain-containing protein [Planctomycetota bacterium]|nr:PilZ domain-containing protein [Planctomycetota bacterium]
MQELTGNPSDRRADTRFPLKPMYSGIEVKLTGEEEAAPFEGHAYDISRGGVNFELDQAIEPGTPIYLKLTLPEWLLGLVDGSADLTSVQIKGTVVWKDDDGVPGPVRMAATFQSFGTIAERELFLRTLKSHQYAVAA